MATVRETLTAAFRMAGLIQVGDEPAADEMAVGLEVFQNFVTTFPKISLTDVFISADYTAGEYERIFNDDSSTHTVTLPTTITDAKTGLDRPPLNGAVVEVSVSSTRVMYVSELGGWQTLTGLTLDSTQPFGPEHEQGLRAIMAVRVAQELQNPNVSEWVAQLAQEGRRAIRQRFRQSVTVTTDPVLLNIFQRNGSALS